MWPWKAKRTLTESRSNGKNARMTNGYRTVRKPFERFGWPFERMNNYLNGLVGHSNGLSNGLVNRSNGLINRSNGLIQRSNGLSNRSNGWINHSNSLVSCSNGWLKLTSRMVCEIVPNGTLCFIIERAILYFVMSIIQELLVLNQNEELNIMLT